MISVIEELFALFYMDFLSKLIGGFEDYPTYLYEAKTIRDKPVTCMRWTITNE